MGTDIHMVAEVRRDGRWEMVKDCLWDGYGGRKTFRPYTGRNYDLFAMLADVRNGYGFAGSVTGDGFVPVVHPRRGIPDDADPETVEPGTDESGTVYEDTFEYLGDHSFNWLTVRELDAYDWDQTTHKVGVFSESEYVNALRTGKPKSWSSGAWGQTIVTLTPEQYEEMLKGGPFEKEGTLQRDPSKRYFIQHRWPITYRDHAEDFLKSLDILRGLGDPDDVRIVFGFDS